MKRISFTLLILSLTTLPFSCKKDKVSCQPVINQNNSCDTVFSSPYLTAYPGSWWKYSDGTIDSCTSWHAVPIDVVSENGACNVTDRDMLNLPHSQTFGYISFESEVMPYDGKSTELIHIFSENPGVLYSMEENGNTGSPNGAFLFKHRFTSYGDVGPLTIGATTYDHVIRIEELRHTYYYHVQGPADPYLFNYYYVKNVGIVQRTSSFGTYSHTAYLIDYHIEL